ncbi:MAG: cupin-like domain-containing protein, partial [Ilumatobacteraceae bacterium]
MATGEHSLMAASGQIVMAADSVESSAPRRSRTLCGGSILAIMPRAIPREHEPSVSVIREQFIDAETPVIISGVADQWPAFSRWTPTYLKAAVGDLTVPVAESQVGDYFDAEKMYGEVSKQEMPWSDFIDAVFSPRPGEPVRYLRQRPLAAFGALAADIETPPFVPRPLLHTNLWVGGAPSVTATHYDSEDNFLVQISGEKELTLFPAKQLSALYP